MSTKLNLSAAPTPFVTVRQHVVIALRPPAPLAPLSSPVPAMSLTRRSQSSHHNHVPQSNSVPPPSTIDMFPPLQCRMYILSTQRNKLEDPNQPALLIPLSRRMRLPSTRSQKMGSSSMRCAMVRSGSDTISWLAGLYTVPCRLKRRQLSRTRGYVRLSLPQFGGANVHSFSAYITFSVPTSTISCQHRQSKNTIMFVTFSSSVTAQYRL